MTSFREWLKAIEEGFGPYIGPCRDTDRYIVQGACSNYNSDAENERIKKGYVKHKKAKQKGK
jgi:hypothetical protein